MQRERRAIRMSDEEWKSFKELLGPEWLRQQIRKAQLKADSLADKAAAQWTN